MCGGRQEGGTGHTLCEVMLLSYCCHTLSLTHLSLFLDFVWLRFLERGLAFTIALGSVTVCRRSSHRDHAR